MNDYEINIKDILEAFKMDPERKNHMDLLVEAFYDNLEREEYVEYGGWGLDDKRPFGNSAVEYDIAEIIGIEANFDDDNDDFICYVNDLYNDLGPYLKYTWLQSKNKE